MRLLLNLNCFSLSTAVVCAALACPGFAQKPVKAKSPDPQSQAPKPPPVQKPPALVDPAGPAISLQSSEALFDIAVALNACGYDYGLAESDPVRMKVRGEVNEATEKSADARDARDQVCAFIDQHRAIETRLDLAQYVSLALYVTPPPELEPSVEEADMPPDSTQVMGILPLLRRFAQAIQLHAIWVANHPAYDEEISQLHDPLTKMIVDTNIYLKMPAGGYDGRRFLVVLEPMLSPSETNARVYGLDYVVIASPKNGAIHMKDVRHTYLHYEIEPLLYARSSAMDRLLPFLKTVRDAPIEFIYRSDIVSLVAESMIRAIEARTMETGVTIVKIPADTPRSALEPIAREHNASVQKDAAIRQESVTRSMVEGYVLTQYFYNALDPFERSGASLKDSIGEMVYGMDVNEEMGHLKNIHFVEEGSMEVVRRAPVQPRGLDLAELDLIKGDAKTASQLSEKALTDHTVDPARANFILARADLVNGDMDKAEEAFRETARLSKDPRMLAWSHIYLGRILDVREQRQEAMVEYKAALAVRDGQPDTKSAAEKGLKQPFALPSRAHADDDDSADDPPSKVPQATAPGTGGAQHPQ